MENLDRELAKCKSAEEVIRAVRNAILVEDRDRASAEAERRRRAARRLNTERAIARLAKNLPFLEITPDEKREIKSKLRGSRHRDTTPDAVARAATRVLARGRGMHVASIIGAYLGTKVDDRSRASRTAPMYVDADVPRIMRMLNFRATNAQRASVFELVISLASSARRSGVGSKIALPAAIYFVLNASLNKRVPLASIAIVTGASPARISSAQPAIRRVAAAMGVTCMPIAEGKKESLSPGGLRRCFVALEAPTNIHAMVEIAQIVAKPGGGELQEYAAAVAAMNAVAAHHPALRHFRRAYKNVPIPLGKFAAGARDLFERAEVDMERQAIASQRVTRLITRAFKFPRQEA